MRAITAILLLGETLSPAKAGSWNEATSTRRDRRIERATRTADYFPTKVRVVEETKVEGQDIVAEKGVGSRAEQEKGAKSLSLNYYCSRGISDHNQRSTRREKETDKSLFVLQHSVAH